MMRADAQQRLPTWLGTLVVAFAAAGCCKSAPESQFPTAGDAIERMRATYRCSRGVGGEAKIDYFEGGKRVRGNLLFFAMRPEKLRFDVYSPFGVIISTLTSDGQDFALYDLQNKQFLQGPANTCNVARFTRVPVPPFAMTQLLGGEAPILEHQPSDATIEWGCGGYIVSIAGKNQARQEITLEPYDADWDKPWSEQRLRVAHVSVEQQGIPLYDAELADHEVAQTAKPIVDPEGLDPTVPPSGPACSAEVPRRIRLLVPDGDQDVVLAYKEIHHNPPQVTGTFRQQAPGGVTRRAADCVDTAAPAP